MDGVFVPNITIGSLVVKSVRPITKIPLDVHLMIDRPERYIDDFAEAGSDLITFHVEASKTPLETIKKIRKHGKKVGISIKPGTLLSEIDEYLDKIDMVLIMTVEPGFGGQSFMREMLDKVQELSKKFDGYIQVDGGINKDTAHLATTKGANVLVAGTAVFKEEDYSVAINNLRK